MISKTVVFTAALLLLFASTEVAQAFCGVIQQSATAKSVAKATRQANRAVDAQVRPLKRTHRAKLQLDQRNVACTGGGVGIDANGNQIFGKPTCTVTQSFCVNP